MRCSGRCNATEAFACAEKQDMRFHTERERPRGVEYALIAGLSLVVALAVIPSAGGKVHSREESMDCSL